MNATLTYDGRPIKAIKVNGTFSFQAYTFADREEYVETAGVGYFYPVHPLEDQIAGEIADALEYRACGLTDSEGVDGLIVTRHGLMGGQHVRVTVREVGEDDWTSADVLQQVEGREGER